MLKFTPLSGLQFGLVSLMICSAAIAMFGPSGVATTSAVQDEIAAPAGKDDMAKFMAQKLAAAQRALEGVSREDFELIRETTTDMIELSRHEAWNQMASPRFVQDTMDFVAAAEFMHRMAETKDAEGISLGFMRLTMTCTNCHSHVRSSKVAQLDFGGQRSNRPVIAWMQTDPPSSLR